MTITRATKAIQLVFATLIVVFAMAVPGRASAAGVSASPNPAPAGSTVTVTGSGFNPGETVEVNFAGDIVSTIADGNGNYMTPFTINSSVPAGGHPLEANGSAGNWADSTLTVLAPAPPPTAPPAPVGGQGSVSASPDPSPAGSTVTVSGSGFVPGETVTVGFAGNMVTTTADGNGNYQTAFTIDSLVPVGSHPLDANGSFGSWANSNLTVSAPAPVPAPQPAPTPTSQPAPQPAPLVPSAPAPVTSAPSAGSTVTTTPAPAVSVTTVPTPATTTPETVTTTDTGTEAESSESGDKTTEDVGDDKVVASAATGQKNGPSDSQTAATDGESDGQDLPWLALLLIFAGLAIAGSAFVAYRQAKPETESTSSDDQPVGAWAPPVEPVA